ncbi:MAG TPA: alanine--tRNA ligase [Casimicrobiaceae bacterium]|jgi:alanyl-tRNA synthetase|nr:alanine--tRNA ligase [Casimicrobiaceae bacterium]
MQVAAIRRQFLDYFSARGHTIVPSASLVPSNDPTLLFTNSGMVQFKDVFLGTDQRSYVRAADVQRCLRAGGKHNDLENVGYTARHHTFFEMLGNWSFGDYFKREAIAYAWELLTEVYKLPADKLWVTVYQTDDEAYAVWSDAIGMPPERVVRIGDNRGAPYASDNFWQMADTGPCGPCSEIFYDHGPTVAGGPPGSTDAGDRYVEIWNLVFMQFDRDHDGVLTPLPKPCVDTGMGLERLAAVLQGVHSNYDIDLFRELITVAAKLTGATDLGSPSLKVIADHIRACAFLVIDGVLPSNEGRGYVLRRIIRRAIRHGYKLGQTKPFFSQLVPELSRLMGGAYPELPPRQEFVMSVLHAEEERFAETLEHGIKILDAALAEAKAMGSTTLSGITAFTLYDTYGFPFDLTADICRERGVSVDQAGFDAAMRRQREQARAASTFKMAEGLEYRGAKTIFDGYDTLAEDARVVALYRDGSSVDALSTGQTGVVVLDRTPFYAESGGQVGDRGELSRTGACLTLFAVHDTQKLQPDVFGHHGEMKTGELKVGDTVAARVDAHARTRAAWNHSATHLMHAALRKVLGAHVTQKGSLVDSHRTRFDFSHPQPLSEEEIRTVEALVNRAIRANYPVEVQLMPHDAAIAAGALALFGEKYGEQVRVLTMGDFSTELCGGTHVSRTGDIGLFKIVSESGVAAGIRRIEAVTAEGALAYTHETEARLQEAARMLKAPAAEVPSKIAHVLDQVRALEKELARIKGRLASSQGGDLAAQAVNVNGAQVLATTIDGADAKVLRETLDQLKGRLRSAAIVLGSTEGGKVMLIAGVTSDLTDKIKAGELVNHVAVQVGGKGGGRPDMAQAGGTNPAGLAAALQSVPTWVAQRL